ncbi:MAG TPA: TauD/TfdA family dioxygenase [Acidimicrobiales bacterium]|nr:TauD/TfdA family dioxygenase [Acidimicrobiales bacterium]
MAAVTIEKLGATIGAEVTGVDRDRVLSDDALPGQCLEALEANGVLVFRELHLDDAAQVAFCRKLGPVETMPGRAGSEIFTVTLDPSKNRSADYLRSTFVWHIDGATDDVPTKASVLTAHVLADSGGETEFASTYAAYEDLSEEEKARFGPVRVVHTFEAAQRLTYPDPTPEVLASWRKRPAKEHPLVWSHRSGRRSLVLGATASHVVGMPVEDGQALLADLLARATVPGRVYRHEWSVGDMVIWDNRGVLHRACPYDPSSPREMHRTTLVGDEPIE